MIPVSLTDFVDFVAASGIPKMTKVREIKYRPNYERMFDYWRILREGIAAFHAQGAKDKKKHFDELLAEMKNGAKREGYRPLVANYKGYIGRKNFVSIPTPRHMVWKRGDLVVRVNPELRLNVNEKPHLIKLYFKALPLSVSKVAIILLLMKQATPRPEEPIIYCLNDVHHNKQYLNESQATIYCLCFMVRPIVSKRYGKVSERFSLGKLYFAWMLSLRDLARASRFAILNGF